MAFFGLMGLLNLWVAYSFSTGTWVNFKLFGGIGLMLLFTLAQGLYLQPLHEGRRGCGHQGAGGLGMSAPGVVQ